MNTARPPASPTHQMLLRDGNSEPVHAVVALSGSSIRWFLFLAIAVILTWYAGDVLLVTFAGVLIGVIMRAIAEWVHEKIGLGLRGSYLAVLLAMVVVIAAICYFLGPRVIDQASQIGQTIPRAISKAHQKLSSFSGGGYISSLLSGGISSLNLGARVSAWVGKAMDEFALLLIALVVGLYLGGDPDPYRRGLLKMFGSRRERAREVLDRIAYTLRWWVVGQLVPMSVLGVGAFIGLSVLGVPLAFTLALFTAVMLFIPYVGSLLSMIPAALVGLAQGPMTMVWVIVIFLAVHGLEGYLITPLSQRRAIRLPPVVTILAELLMWTISGLLGLVIATPLAAAVLVTIEMVYFHRKPEETP